MTQPSNDDELSKLLEDARRPHVAPKRGAGRRQHRARRLRALSFGGGVMLVVFNLVGEGSAGPDTLSLAAAILLGCIALLQLLGRSKLRQEERSHPASIVMLFVLAAILALQAQWSQSPEVAPSEEGSSANGAPDVAGDEEG